MRIILNDNMQSLEIAELHEQTPVNYFKFYSIKRICLNIKTRNNQTWKTNIYNTSHFQKATAFSVKNKPEKSQET